MAEKEKGKVKWFNNSKGYGFIEREKGDDIFLHYSSIKMDGYRTVKEGQEVEFVVTNGAKGLQADEVEPGKCRRRFSTDRRRYFYADMMKTAASAPPQYPNTCSGASSTTSP